jgi:hypothetical protein
VFVEGNKWKDLSGEFCEEIEWKQGLTTEKIQQIHSAFYNKELALRQNHPWQLGLGGTPAEFREYLKRMTQFATITYLENLWKDKEIGAEKYIPIWRNIKDAALSIKLANGDMTYYVRSA